MININIIIIMILFTISFGFLASVLVWYLQRGILPFEDTISDFIIWIKNKKER